MILPVILSGGSGTRLWPLSRGAYPKQFLPLLEEDSLFQTTVKRVLGVKGCTEPMIICNEAHRFLVAEQLRQMGTVASSIVLEPAGRNTAPAVTCAALMAIEQQENAVLFVMPSDHAIQNTDAFRDTFQQGARAALDGKLITFGIIPSRPETGYGYIKKGRSDAASSNIYPVAEFVEKPDEATAQSYLQSGEYLWNSGMFMFRADTFLSEIERLQPDIYSACRQAVENSCKDLDFTRLGEEEFLNCPGNSIDYAVMEKTEKAAVLPLDAGWSDVGAWPALRKMQSPDTMGNVCIGDTIIEEVKNCYIRSDHRLVACIGVENLVVVETADAVLITDINHAQKVKDIVDKIKQSDREEHLYHTRVFRPWGSFETIDESDRFKVKRIIVNPGASLSLQMHHHRAEHWVVVKGTAKITRGEDEITLNEDQSVYIPLGTRHRLENPGLIPLEIIEIQSGSYLGEDDIVRFSDAYGRDNC